MFFGQLQYWVCMWDTAVNVSIRELVHRKSLLRALHVYFSGGQVSVSSGRRRWLQAARQQHVYHAPRMDSRAQSLWHPRLQGFELPNRHIPSSQVLMLKPAAQFKHIFGDPEPSKCPGALQG